MSATSAFLRSFSAVLASQIVATGIGFSTLPFIARALGVEEYGAFSFFMALVALINTLEFGRVLFTREFIASHDFAKLHDLVWIAIANTIAIAIIGFFVGHFFLSSTRAALLAATCMFHALAAPDYAWLTRDNQLSRAMIIRNSLWALAYVAVTVGSYLFGRAFPFELPFLAANILTFFMYRLVCRRPIAALRMPSWSQLTPYIRHALAIYGFNVAAIVNSSAPTVVLQRNISSDLFGQYMAQSDLAFRINTLSTVLSRTTYPMLASAYHRGGLVAASTLFVRIYRLFNALYFVGIGIMMICSDFLMSSLFGAAFVNSFNFHPLFLFAVYANLYGFLFVPLSRKSGDFTVSRNAQAISAVGVLISAVTLIPRFGTYGAIVSCIAGRLADIIIAGKGMASLSRRVMTAKEIAASVLGGIFLAGLALVQSN